MNGFFQELDVSWFLDLGFTTVFRRLGILFFVWIWILTGLSDLGQVSQELEGWFSGTLDEVFLGLDQLGFSWIRIVVVADTKM